MSDSLVERLRSYRPTNEWGDDVHHVICDEAAARIQALETSLAEAEGRVIAEVVAWLRHQHVEIRAMRSPVRNLDDIATALETGEWKK